MPFPPSSAPPSSPAPGTIVARTLGSLNLNDRVQTFFRYDSIPGVNKHTFGQRIRAQGEQIPVLVDKTGLEITVYGRFHEVAGMLQWEDWQDLLEQQLGVIYNNGYRAYYPVWVKDCIGTIDKVDALGSDRPYRWMTWSFKLACRYTTHY